MLSYKTKKEWERFLNYFNKVIASIKHHKTRHNSNSELSFKMLFYEIIDNIIMQLNVRFIFIDKL